jgi:hypothetical protein
MDRTLRNVFAVVLLSAAAACTPVRSQEVAPPPPPMVAAPAPPPMVSPPPPPSEPYVVPRSGHRVAKRSHRMMRHGYRGGHCVVHQRKVFNRYSHRYEVRPVRICR